MCRALNSKRQNKKFLFYQKVCDSYNQRPFLAFIHIPQKFLIPKRTELFWKEKFFRNVSKKKVYKQYWMTFIWALCLCVKFKFDGRNEKTQSHLFLIVSHFLWFLLKSLKILKGHLSKLVKVLLSGQVWQ